VETEQYDLAEFTEAADRVIRRKDKNPDKKNWLF
jgi:hypothetical protein